MRVSDLREELKKRGQVTSGKKSDLVERLKECMKQHQVSFLVGSLIETRIVLFVPQSDRQHNSKGRLIYAFFLVFMCSAPH